LINNRIKTKEKLRIYQKGFEHSKAVTADDFINFSFYEYIFFKIFTVNDVLIKKKYSQISSPVILANIAGKTGAAYADSCSRSGTERSGHATKVKQTSFRLIFFNKNRKTYPKRTLIVALYNYEQTVIFLKSYLSYQEEWIKKARF
jgi:hypothetical protein